MVSGWRFLSFTDCPLQGCTASWLPPSLEGLPAATFMDRTRLDEMLGKHATGGLCELAHKLIFSTAPCMALVDS